MLMRLGRFYFVISVTVATTEEFVSAMWCTLLGIPEDVAIKLVAARWRVGGLPSNEERFEKVLHEAGCLDGIDAAWRARQGT